MTEQNLISNFENKTVVVSLLNQILHYTEITNTLIYYYLFDEMYFFLSLPLSKQRILSKKYGTSHIIDAHNKYFTLCGKLHLFGPSRPSSVMYRKPTVFRVCGELHRENDRPAVFYNLNKEWWYFGVRHRSNDQPAIDTPSKKEWWVAGKRHRGNDQPALVTAKTKEWWVNGLRHRDGDQPAVESTNLHKEWWVRGVLHRDNDEPAIMGARELRKEWYINGQLHRDGDKPARVRLTGVLEWWCRDVRHRDDNKPAVVYPNGRVEYWVNGVQKFPFTRQTKQNISNHKPKSPNKHKGDRIDFLLNKITNVS